MILKNLKFLQFTLIVGCILVSCKPPLIEDTSPIINQEYSESWKFRQGEGTDSLWMSATHDDSKWLDISSAKTLKEQSTTTDNGFGWYRKSISFSDSMRVAIKNKGAVLLHLGKFASCEELYVNGKLVGKTGDFPPNYTGYTDHERNYLIFAEDLKIDGDNLIAIKFNEGWGTGGFLSKNNLTISSAQTNDKILLETHVKDSDYVFLGVDPISVTIDLQNKNKWNINGKLLVSLTTDDFQPIKTDSFDVKLDGNAAFSQLVEFKDPKPGFYRYKMQFKRDSTIVCENKLTVGYEPEKINSPINANSDFKEFWDNNLKELAKVAPNYKLTLQPKESSNDYEIYLVEMRSFENELIRGYYAKPKKEGKHPVIVEYMGYGSSAFIPTRTWDGFAHFVLSTRGQGLNQPTNRFGNWITYGLDSKVKYYYRGAFLDVVRAIDFVCSCSEIDADRIGVKGGSQGGAFTFAAAALDKRVKAAAPTIPFLSDYPDYFKIASWPKSDFDTYLKEHPEAKWEDVYNLLTYFDIKNLAQWIECPLLMGGGMQDEVCPPHINFAAYNQVKSEKRWMTFPLFGHSVGKEYFEASNDFFKEKLNLK